MKIDFKKITKATGIEFPDEIMTDKEKEQFLYDYIVDSLYYLRTHNKNYNSKQFWKIIELDDILGCIEVE